MKNVFYFALVILVSFSLQSKCLSQNKQSFDSIINANKYTFSINDNQIIGNGKRFLQQEATSSQFFMIGELHGNNETPIFSKAILNLLQSYNYKHFAIEVGPYSEKKISSILNQKKGINLLAEFYKKYDLKKSKASSPIPFFDLLDEALLLEYAVKNNYKLWGLDQEFINAPLFLLDDIYEMCKSKIPNQELKQLHNSAKKKFLEIMSNNSKSMFHELSTNKEIKRFFETASEISEEAESIIDEIHVSWKIYGHNKFNQYFDANNSRAQLMKRYFSQYYNEVVKNENTPKVIVKMGSMHMGYGKSPLGIYDIGNSMHELAKLNNSKTFNLAVAGRYYFLDDKKVDRLPYVPEYEIFFKHEETEGFTIIDLRPLRKAFRNKTVKVSNRKLINLLDRYDALILCSLSKASHKTQDFKN